MRTSFILTCALALNSIALFCQKWESVIPDPEFEMAFLNRCVEFDGELYVFRNDVISKKKIRIFNGNSWRTFNLLMNSIEGEVTYITMSKAGDTALVIGTYSYESSLLQTFLYDGKDLVELSRFKNNFYPNSYHPLALVTDDYITYIDKNEANPSNVFVINYYPNTTRDTIAEIGIINNHDVLTGKTASGIAFYGIINPGTGNQIGPFLYYNGTSVSSFSAWDVLAKKTTVFNNNMVFTSSDPQNASSNPMRRVTSFNGTTTSHIGDVNFKDSYGITSHKNLLYVSARNASMKSSIFSYNGISYTDFSGDDEFQYQNPNNLNYFDRYTTDLFVFKDWLYAFGDFNRIDSTIQVAGMARKKLLNTTNLAPQANNDIYSINDIDLLRAKIGNNDTDANGDYLYTSIIQEPKDGMASIHTSDDIIYQPNLGFNGSDTVFYKICDLGGLCDSAFLIVQVTSVSPSPISLNDTVVTDENTAVGVHLLENDIYHNEPVTITLLQTASNGNVSLLPNNTINYEPFNSFVGVDSFQYEICKSYDRCATAWVIITVNLVNENPTSQNDTIQLSSNSVYIYPLLNDTDPDGDPIYLELVAGPFNTNSSIVAYSDKFFFETSNLQSFLMDSLQYKVYDDFGGEDTAWCYISKNEVSISENHLSHDFNIYPNPNSGTFTLINPNKNKFVGIKIYDVLGKMVYSSSSNKENIEIKIDDAEAGVYIVELILFKQVLIQKVVVRK
jgi:hypothetical protein